jgi:hypothetical protein
VKLKHASSPYFVKCSPPQCAGCAAFLQPEELAVGGNVGEHRSNDCLYYRDEGYFGLRPTWKKGCCVRQEASRNAH